MNVILALAYAAFDWFSGRGYIKQWGWRGRPLWYCLPPLAGVQYLLAPELWPMALSWAAWRGLLGWKAFGGSTTPKGTKMILGTFARHLIILPGAWFVPHHWWALSAVLVWAMFATVCDSVRANNSADDGLSQGLDAVRGLAYGGILAVLHSFNGT